MHRIFLLSPAHSGGQRAALISNPKAGFALAHALQRGESRPLSEVFRFLSGLYFRGKLAYAEAFGRPPPRRSGGYVITSNRGLLPVHAPITLPELQAFGAVPIDAKEPRYLGPLQRSVRAVSKAAADCEFVLLGSISTTKYVEPLLEILGERLLFPTDFLGRGDMSRGGLLLRAVRDGRELAYQPVAGAVRRGPRPPRLEPVSWRGTPLGENTSAKSIAAVTQRLKSNRARPSPAQPS